MKLSLRSKLSLSYILIIILIVSSASFFTNFLLEKQFREYVIAQQVQENQRIVDLIAQHYQEDGGFRPEVMESIGLDALKQGVIVRVRDSTSLIVWDAMTHDHAACVEVLAHMQQNMNSRYPNFQGAYVENTYPIEQNQQLVGAVDIGYYGPFYFTDSDLKFISTVNITLLAVGACSLVLALILGAEMAKRISNPVSRVILAAQQISRGDFRERITEKSTTSEIIQLTGTVNDLAETLQQQESLRRRLTADVAHELRTPLATLQSHLEAMIDGVWQPDTARLTGCHEEILRLNRLVGDLERLARFEGENLVLDKTSWQLRQLVERITQNFAAEAKQKDIQINLTGADPAVFADQDKISQVVVNLLSNALKYTPAGGMIELALAEADDTVEFSVRDNGDGISPEDLPHIFERFYRADQSRNRLTGGSGIGLAIVKAIAEAHQGTIVARSRQGAGSEFIITLPKHAN